MPMAALNDGTAVPLRWSWAPWENGRCDTRDLDDFFVGKCILRLDVIVIDEAIDEANDQCI